MNEVPYSNLRFNNAPIRRRIFWSVLSGFIAAFFLGDFVSRHNTIPDVPLVTVGFLSSFRFLSGVALFFCVTLLVHLILLLVECPRFQFSLLRLLIVSIFVALVFTANLLPQSESRGDVLGASQYTVRAYGWPMPLCHAVHYDSGHTAQLWHPVNCALGVALVVLAVLNVLLFKFPERSPKPSAPSVFPLF